MTHSFRKKIFWIFVVIFALTGTAIIYYAKGFRFDMATLSITHTGAIEIESAPRTVDIYLNEESYKNKSSIIQKGTLIKSVIPKKYRLVLKKEGFHDYEKNIDVQENRVTRVLNALLVPLVIQTATSSSYATGTTIVDTDNTNRIILFNEKTGTHTITSFDSTITPINLNTKIASFFKQKIEHILFYPQETNKFLAKTANGIYRVDIKTQDVTTITTSSITFFKKDGNNLLVVSSNKPIPPSKKGTKTIATTTPDQLAIIDLTLNAVGSTITLPQQEGKIKDVLVSNNRYIFLFDNGDMYIKENPSAQEQKIAHNAQRAIFSPNGTKVLYQDYDGKIFVRLLEDDIIALDTEKNAIIRLAIIDAGRIKNIWWHWNSYHIIIQYPQKITLAEVTKTEPNNHTTIVQTTATIWYDQSIKALYALSENKLTRTSLEW